MSESDDKDTSKDKPRILHVSADFPDPIAPDKTPVFRRLIDLTSESFDHRVTSLNRAPFSLGHALRGSLVSQTEFEYGLAARYYAPGKGLFHAAFLNRLGIWLTQQASEGREPDLIIGHKLTIEGMVVAKAASELGVPYALTLQGDTDCKILDVRRDLRKQFAEIYMGATAIHAFAPWTIGAVESRLGVNHPNIAVIPCPAKLDELHSPSTGGGELLSVFHLKNARRKNLDGIANAMGLIDGQKDARLSIIGGGSERDWKQAKMLAQGCTSIDFAGRLEPGELGNRMNGAIGLVLPSRRESFGLVFIEALMNGLPVVYPKGAAIEGWFENHSFAVAVDVREPQDIADAMSRLIEGESELKADLATWQQSGDATRFFDSTIAGQVTRHWRSAIGL